MNINKIGIVVIGRNEGIRLACCLDSIKATNCKNIVYVDSGSTDTSIEIATERGINVCRLDNSLPFSAGRARNAGYEFAKEHFDGMEYIQFIDGDCELINGWIEDACQQIVANQNWGIVAGQVKEKKPNASIFNRLCDIEWNSYDGEVRSCGGIFMARRAAFDAVDGFNPTIIAGEEPELCYRLRMNGWKIYQLNRLMVLHDASMYKLSQWWKRAIRSGHAYAQGVALYGNEEERFCVIDSLRIWFWALFLPVIIIFATIIWSPYFIGLFGIYVVQWIKVAWKMNKILKNRKNSIAYSFFNILAKFPQLHGQISFSINFLLKNDKKIIEYK